MLTAATTEQSFGKARREPPAALKNPKPHECRLKGVLVAYLDQIVVRLMQIRAAHRQWRLKIKELMRELDHRARHSTGLSRDAQRPTA